MPEAQNQRRYSGGAIFLHWAIAALITWNLVLGFQMHAATGLRQFNLFQLHKSVGISILLLSFARLLWRLGHRPPPLPAEILGREKALAHIVHASLYVIMIGMPLTGWVVVSTSNFNIPTLLFSFMPWPHLPLFHDLEAVAKAKVNAGFELTHLVLAWGTLALLALHLGGVLKHLLIDRIPGLAPMTPTMLRRPRKGISE